MEPVIAESIAYEFENIEDRVEDLETDKAATPAERGTTLDPLFQAKRPNAIVIVLLPSGAPFSGCSPAFAFFGAGA